MALQVKWEAMKQMLVNDDEILQWTSRFNIIFMSETHLTKGQKFELKSYKAHHHPFSDTDCRNPCGGVSAFIHNSIEEYAKRLIP